MTNGEYITKIAEQGEDFCIFRDDVAGTVTIEVSLDWWNKPQESGKLVDVGKCDRNLFYQQCGGADSLITVKTAFDMLLSLPTIIESDKEQK